MASEIESKLPKPLNRSDAGLSTFSSSAGAFGVVLGQEIDRFNRLLSTIGSSLNELGRALQGLVVMSADLEVMYSKMLNNQVGGSRSVARVSFPCRAATSRIVEGTKRMYPRVPTCWNVYNEFS